ncbi:Helix-turn-helix transcriptional regulator [Candidatus Hepatincolaceae symbiont of Richtersius coronifer]
MKKLHLFINNKYYQNELAKILGISQSYLSNILKGRRRPSLILVVKLQWLSKGDITIEDFVGFSYNILSNNKQQRNK